MEVALIVAVTFFGLAALSWAIARCERMERPSGHKVRIVVELREGCGPYASTTEGDALLCDMTCEQIAAYLDRFGGDYTLVESQGVAVVARRCVVS